MIGVDRATIVKGWLYWATFRVGVAHGYGIVNANSIARAAVRDLMTADCDDSEDWEA